jgi:hypothetical protein
MTISKSAGSFNRNPLGIGAAKAGRQRVRNLRAANQLSSANRRAANVRWTKYRAEREAAARADTVAVWIAKGGREVLEL